MSLDQALAARVAQTRRALTEVEAQHTEAAAKVATIAHRITETEDRRQAITAARLAGTAKPEQAAELAALAEDLEALRRMHGEAEREALAILPSLENARAAVGRAETEWHQNAAAEEHAALVARTAEIEAAFLRAIAATVAAGRKMGHKFPRQSWMPSNELTAVVSHGASPRI